MLIVFNGGIDGGLLMRTQLLLEERLLTDLALRQLLPIDVGILKFIEPEPIERRRLILDHLRGIIVPKVGGRNPQPLSEIDGVIVDGEGAARGGEERIDGGLIDPNVGLIKFALDSPIIVVPIDGDDVNADVVTAELITLSELAPQADVGEVVDGGGE